MTTTIAINCGCGVRFAESATTILSPIGTAVNGVKQPLKALVAAQDHCRETGHTVEILGSVQP